MNAEQMASAGLDPLLGVEELAEYLGATNLHLHLGPEDLTELNDASASVQVQGDRYPEAMQKMIDR